MIDRFLRWLHNREALNNAERQRQHDERNLRESEQRLSDLSRRMYVRAQIRSVYHNRNLSR